MAYAPEMYTAGRGHKMIRTIIIIPLAVFFLGGSPALGNEELPDILKGIRNKYSQLPGLSISYSREVITGTMSMLGNQIKGDLATGQIYFRPPYSLRLEQETPKPEVIISDGDAFWWYIPHKKQAYQSRSREFGRELRLLSNIFRGLMDVEETFKVTMLCRNEQGEYQIELRPDPPWEQIDRIVIAVTSGYEIRVVNNHNQLGTITRFTLEGLTKKEVFERDFFKFVVPEGVQILQDKGQ
jgi:outer membrane lipoprotein-sorting protein